MDEIESLKSRILALESSNLAQRKALEDIADGKGEGLPRLTQESDIPDFRGRMWEWSQVTARKVLSSPSSLNSIEERVLCENCGHVKSGHWRSIFNPLRGGCDFSECSCDGLTIIPVPDFRE